MKNRFLIYPLIAMGLLLFINGCKKEKEEIKLTYGSVTDIDQNVYKTITIGTQTWMAENLKVTHYRNGDPIPNITVDAEWNSLTTGAYCWHKNDVDNKDIYGALYNWYAVSDSRNIAPNGWHVPTYEEWKTLITYLGGESVAGYKMKESGTTHWHSLLNNATNQSGFTALPGCRRTHFQSTLSDGLGYFGYWWSSTESNESAWALTLIVDDGYATLDKDPLKDYGDSVRCIKD